MGFHVRYEPPPEYDIRLRVRHVSGEGTMGLGVVGGGRQFQFVVDVGKDYCALQFVDGKGYRDRLNPTHVQRSLFSKGEFSDFLLQVRKTGLVVKWEAESILEWKGGFKRLALHNWFKFANPREMFLLAENITLHIEKFEVIPIGPQPTPVPSPPVAAKKLPLPSDAAQQQALEQIQDLFKDDYTAAKSSSQKSELATKLLQQAAESKDVDRFVLPPRGTTGGD